MLRAVYIKTQARRLSILSELINLIHKKGSQKALIHNRIVSWSKENTHYFSAIPSNTGEIRPSKDKGLSNSFKNYLDAATQLKLVNEISGVLSPSKYGMVLKNLMLKRDKNPYLLTAIEKIFYLFIILKNDADIFITVCQMINNYPNKNTTYYLELFQNEYQNRLSKKAEFLKGKSKEEVMEALNRVKNWQSAKRYSEDIVPPRLNWMKDLEFLNLTILETGEYQLNNSGKKLLDALINRDTILDVSEDWFYNRYISNIFYTLDTISWVDLSEESKENLLRTYLQKAITTFSILNIPRIPLEESLFYIIISLYIKENIVSDFYDIESFIGYDRLLENSHYGIRKSARSYESYIIVRNGL